MFELFLVVDFLISLVKRHWPASIDRKRFIEWGIEAAYKKLVQMAIEWIIPILVALIVALYHR